MQLLNKPCLGENKPSTLEPLSYQLSVPLPPHVFLLLQR